MGDVQGQDGGRGGRRGRSAALVAMVLGALLVAPAAASAAPACAAEAAGEAAAVSLARSCRRPVVVGSSRTELTQVVARPDGRLTFESAVAPQRVRTAAGWADVDLALAAGPDGRLRPAMSAAEVSFSGGGNGPLVGLARDGHTMTLSWPGRPLPKPAVAGDTATYPGVLPDVDLVVRATRTGFSHTLVVKTPEAAADPAVREIRMGVGGDVALRRDPDGGLRALAGDALVAEAPPAVMWDSRSRTAKATRSSAAAPGDEARVAGVRTQVAGKSLVLRADPALLDAPDRTFPIYVDPEWSAFKSKWAYSTDNGTSNNTTSARVGRNPETGALYRSYFAFPTTANGVFLGGKYIHSARVEMKLDHSWDCHETSSTMYLTGPINATPRASWTGMYLGPQLAQAWGSANEAGGCDTIRQDMIMNFLGNGLLDHVRVAARDSWGDFTVAVTARNAEGNLEGQTNRWKRFFPENTKLYVDYDSIPGPPNALQVAGVACPADGVVQIGTLTPTLSAVLPDADPQTIMGYFEYVEVPASGRPDDATTRLKPPGADPLTTANTRVASAPITIAQGKTYAFHVTAKDPAPYERWSGWGAWCKFTADTSVPVAPQLTATTPQGAGRPVTFTLRSTETDVTKFRYGWASPPATEVAAGASRSATVTLTPPRFGKNTLWVRAIDTVGNLGNLASITVTVGRPSPPVAAWGLERYPGITAAQALTDRQPATAGDTPLTPAEPVAWSGDSRVVGGQAATFDYHGYLSTSGPVVNTAGSFSVAAWARLADADPSDPDPDLPTGNRSVAGQSGQWRSPFFLGYRIVEGQSRWGLYMPGADDQIGGGTIASPKLVTTADIGRWVHLAAVYDAAAQRMKLYVDGELAAERAVPTFNATGNFTVGAALWSAPDGQPWMGDRWQGQIADVQVFDRVLLDQDFAGQLAADPQSGGFNEPGILTPAQVGAWNFNAAVPCYDTAVPDTCEAPDSTTAFNRWLALSRGADVGAGRSTGDAGLWLDDKYFPDQGQSGTTEEYGRSAYKNGGWQDAPVLRTDQSFSISAWVMPGSLDASRTVVAQRAEQESAAALRYDAPTGRWQFRVAAGDSAAAARVSVSSSAAANAQVWTQLTGVYDAARGQVRLYVNGSLAGTQAVTFTPMAAAGPLLVGRGRYDGRLTEQWHGGIDDVAAFQGALTDTAVTIGYHAQIAPRSGTSVLPRGLRLTSGQTIRSDAGNYLLRMQDDGNLVVTQGGAPLWDSRTWGNPGAWAYVQGDGNFVVYRADGAPLWDTRTWGSAADRVILRDDGDLVLLDAAGRVFWHR